MAAAYPLVPRSRRRNSSSGRARHHPFDPKPLAIVVCYLQSTAYVASLDFYRDLCGVREKARDLLLSIWPMRKSISRQYPASVLQFRRDHVTWIYLDVEDVFHAAGDDLPSATTAYRRTGAGNPISIRRVHADSVAATAALNVGRLHSRDARHLPQAPGSL